ncbi:MAG TPA: Rid family detoxifying hydrolase [Thermoanaerobaculia bacterium]|nr:Rid family detoxifying hydrolase [Thermoanaerobaculia bacterium]
MTGGQMTSQTLTPPRHRRRFSALALLCLTVLGCAIGATGGSREVVSTAGAAGAIGPYSQAVWAGNTLYLSGQIGIDPATGQLVPGGFEAEAKRALDNCRTILSAAGLTLADVVQVQVFLADMADYAALNAVYAPYFPAQPPARAAIGVAALPRGARVEILMTAARPAR